MNFRKVFFIFLGVSFLVLTQWGIAKDEVSQRSLEVSPPSQEIDANPGSEVFAKAKIRNKSKEKLTMQVRVEDFTATGQDGQVALLEKNDNSLKNWTVLDQDHFELNAGEVKEITAAIKIPEKAAGGQYGSFVFSVVADSPQPGTAALAQEVASLFLIRVSGEQKELLVLTDFAVPRFLQFGPVPMSLKFKNSGNVHIKPFGLINVRNVFGKTVKDLVIKGETNILPGAVRVLKINYEERYLFGYYTAEALMSYGARNESLSSTVNFFVFPLRWFLAAVLVVCVLYKMRLRIRRAADALMGL